MLTSQHISEPGANYSSRRCSARFAQANDAVVAFDLHNRAHRRCSSRPGKIAHTLYRYGDWYSANRFNFHCETGAA
jgi:hypothetical protein